MLIFLYGNDSFRSRQKMDELKERFSAKKPGGSGLSLVDFDEETDGGKVAELCRGGDLFSGQKLVIVKNIFGSAGSEAQGRVSDFLRQDEKLSASKDTVVVFWEDSLPKGKNKLLEYLKKTASSHEFKPLEGNKLVQWIAHHAKSLDERAKISRQAADLLAVYAGSDLSKIHNELLKLTNYKDGELITENDVKLLVKSDIQSDIFATVEAFSRNDKKTALRLLHSQIREGADPFYIFSMYVYQFRNLLKIGDCYRRGISNKFDIAREIKLHPYVVQKGLQQIGSLPWGKLNAVYRKLKDTDLAVKTGKADIETALDRLIVEA